MEKYFNVVVRLGLGCVKGVLQGTYYIDYGSIIITDTELNGYITDSYIEGKINEETVDLIFYLGDYGDYSVSIERDEFILPDTFLFTYQDCILEFTVESEIKEKGRQKQIKRIIEEIK